MKVAVIVLHYKGIEVTRECLTSLYSSTYSNFETLLVDNASIDGGGRVLKQEFPLVRLLSLPQNQGFCGGNNRAIEQAIEDKFDGILLLNNDTVLDKECLQAFVETSLQYPQAVLGGFVYDDPEKKRLQHFGGNWDREKGKLINQPIDLMREEDWQEVSRLDFVKGCSLFAPTSIFQKVGLLEERFFLYYEEIDWCFRAKREGFPSLVCKGAKLWHKEGSSFSSPKVAQSYYQSRNRLLFLKRNLPSKEYRRWLIRKFFPSLLNQIGKFFLKSLQKVFPSPENALKAQALKASLAGVKDYYFSRFGKAPSKYHS